MTKKELKIINHLSKDEVLGDVIKQLSLPKLNVSSNFFHDLMSCIIEQQIHYRSTKKIFERVLNNAKIEDLTIQNFHKLEESNFKGATLSIKKYETIQSVLDLFSDEETEWNSLKNEEIHRKLGVINGVGIKTIDSLLIYSLGREDVFIPDDYHIEKIMASLYKLNPSSNLKAQINSISQDFSPYKSYAFLLLLNWKNKKTN